MKTYRIITKPNRLMPHAQTLDMPSAEILTNDVVFPWEQHPHQMRLWVIGNAYGTLGATWACCEQEAMDMLCDAGLSAGLSADEPDDDATDEEREEWEENVTRLGNAGEPHDLTYAWMQEVDLTETPVQTIAALAEARGQNINNLSEL